MLSSAANAPNAFVPDTARSRTKRGMLWPAAALCLLLLPLGTIARAGDTAGCSPKGVDVCQQAKSHAEASMIDYGGTIVSRFLSADGHLTAEYRISYCEQQPDDAKGDER